MASTVTRYSTMVVMFFFTAQVGNAAIMVFDDRLAWEGAVAGPVLIEDFEGLSTGTLAPDTTHSLGLINFSYTGLPTGSSAGLVPAIVDGFGSGSRSFVGNPYREANGGGTTLPGVHVFTFNSPITAFGADFTAIDAADLIIEVGGESCSLMSVFAGESSGYFGIVSDSAFTSLTMAAGTMPVINEWFTMDDVSISAVPLPGAFWLLATAVAGMLIRRPRRYY